MADGGNNTLDGSLSVAFEGAHDKRLPEKGCCITQQAYMMQEAVK